MSDNLYIVATLIGFLFGVGTTVIGYWIVGYYDKVEEDENSKDV